MALMKMKLKAIMCGDRRLGNDIDTLQTFRGHRFVITFRGHRFVITYMYTSHNHTQ